MIKQCSVSVSSRLDSTRNKLFLKNAKLFDKEIYKLEDLQTFYKHKYTNPIKLDSQTNDYLRIE